MIRSLTLRTSITACLALASACGGGGGGGNDSNQPAIVRIDAEPRNLDTRDRLLVKVYIQDVHQDGILLKIRTPTELDYYPDSAILTQDSDFFRIRPTERGRGRVGDERNYDYIVFSLPRTLFDLDNEAELAFEMIADGVVTDGQIEVDADINNPLIEDRDEFQFSNPDFTTEDSITVSVVD